jgi:hypothetical protein
MKWSLLALVLSALAIPVLADDAAPDKSDYTLFNPTPDADLRSFSTDRPPKANSPYTVDAGHSQYETDIAVFAYVRQQRGRQDPGLDRGRSDSEVGADQYD